MHHHAQLAFLLRQRLRQAANAALQVDELADAAHGYVAADLAALCSEAAMTALRRVVASNVRGCGSEALCRVTLADFQAAETRTRPSAMRELAFEIPRVGWVGLLCALELEAGPLWRGACCMQSA